MWATNISYSAVIEIQLNFHAFKKKRPKKRARAHFWALSLSTQREISSLPQLVVEEFPVQSLFANARLIFSGGKLIFEKCSNVKKNWSVERDVNLTVVGFFGFLLSFYFFFFLKKKGGSSSPLPPKKDNTKVAKKSQVKKVCWAASLCVRACVRCQSSTFRCFWWVWPDLIRASHKIVRWMVSTLNIIMQKLPVVVVTPEPEVLMAVDTLLLLTWIKTDGFPLLLYLLSKNSFIFGGILVETFNVSKMICFCRESPTSHYPQATHKSKKRNICG